MKKNLIAALQSKLLGEQAVALAEIDLMLENPRVIPEHTNFMDELMSKFATLAEINDKLEAIDLYETSYMRERTL
jgi:replication initiation and membrane attachment protein DnaB